MNTSPETPHTREAAIEACRASGVSNPEDVARRSWPELFDFQQYRRKQIAELRPWCPGDDMVAISVSAEDTKAGSPKSGDMIARNPKNHADQWLVAAAYFADNFEPIDAMLATRKTGGAA